MAYVEETLHSTLPHNDKYSKVMTQMRPGVRPQRKSSFKRMMIEKGNEEFQVPTDNEFVIDLSTLKNDALKEKVMVIIHAQIPDWADVTASDLKMDRISGALTNCVFMVTAPPSPSGSSKNPRKLLLRVYGVGVDQLFQREKEIGWLKLLSQLNIGAQLRGIFKNGRLEQYLDSTTLTKEDIREPSVSRRIAHRMFELHNISKHFPPSDDENIELWTNIQKWYPLAVKSASAISSKPNTTVGQKCRIEQLLFNLERDIENYKSYLSSISSPIVFAHNDTQYGNILRLSRPPHELVVVDYEYAGYNPRGFDIANHFCEWSADYHSSEPHLLHFERFPNSEEQYNFLDSYLEAKKEITGSLEDEFAKLPADANKDDLISALSKEVSAFIPVSNLMWGLWGIVQAANSEIEFDYLAYGAQRIEAFRKSSELNERR